MFAVPSEVVKISWKRYAVNARIEITPDGRANRLRGFQLAAPINNIGLKRAREAAD